MNAKQRRIVNRKWSNTAQINYSKIISQLKPATETDVSFEYLIKDFNQPGPSGVIFDLESVTKVLDQEFCQKTVFCELDPYFGKRYSNLDKVFEVNLGNAICSISELRYDPETHFLYGKIKPIKRVFGNLKEDLCRDSLYFGLRTICEQPGNKIVSLISIDIHIHKNKLGV